MSEPEFIEARTTQPSFTVETAKVLAEVAHNRQKDKLKRPYREHVIAVGDALADFDDDIRIAGYLHDIAEDTPMTRQALLDMGVSERAVDIIERVTKRLHENPDDYQAGIRYIAEDHDATLVKIADNAHNSLPERVKALAEKWPDKPPVTRYNDARPVLYAAVPVEETRKILARINPWLLEELDDLLDEADDTDYENLSYDDAAGSRGGRAPTGCRTSGAPGRARRIRSPSCRAEHPTAAAEPGGQLRQRSVPSIPSTAGCELAGTDAVGPGPSRSELRAAAACSPELAARDCADPGLGSSRRRCTRLTGFRPSATNGPATRLFISCPGRGCADHAPRGAEVSTAWPRCDAGAAVGRGPRSRYTREDVP